MKFTPRGIAWAIIFLNLAIFCGIQIYILIMLWCK